jgi:hypothetical protein
MSLNGPPGGSVRYEEKNLLSLLGIEPRLHDGPAVATPTDLPLMAGVSKGLMNNAACTVIIKEEPKTEDILTPIELHYWEATC